MKKVLLSLVALSALATALPAAAQGYGYGQPPAYGRPDYDSRAWTPIQVRLDRLQDRIQRGVQNGGLTRREAQGLRAEFRALVDRERAYSRGGLTWQERADLDARFERLNARVRFERHDREDRSDRRDGYGRDDRRGY